MAKHNDGQSAMSTVERCLSQVRAMILDGELLPGQKVLQADLAERLKVSRVPLREALSTLQAEGILDQRPNTGWTVSRFSPDDVAQLYRMRQLLETELLRTLDDDALDLDELASLNREAADLVPTGNGEAIERVAHIFHDKIFAASRLHLVREEVERLWYRSSFYRNTYLSTPQSHQKIIDDHDAILTAFRAGDIDRVIALHDDHRVATPDFYAAGGQT